MQTADAIFSPSQLNTLARDLLEGSFPLIWVEAELGSVARPASGHLYFTLKDARAQIRAAMFRPKSTWLKFVPREGMRVLARGRVTLYEARGEYQMVLEHMEEAGEGALRRAFEALKARLEAEGLFAAERKRPLPSFPRHLGVLTSPTGAAIQDVLSVLARRFPLLHVDILPIPVQGENAAAQIRQMLERAASSGRYDLLLLTRGGGSLEDLWAFNDEALARTIAASSVPVVSAIGHETDFTLADFAADLRAPTPSAAAEIITPDQAALAQRLARLGQRLGADTRHRLHGSMQHLDRLRLRLDAQSPGNRLALLQARLQQAQRALASRMGRQLQEARHHTRQLAGQLHAQAPARRLLLSRQRLASLEHRPLAALEHRLQLHRQHLALLAGRPQACLQQQIHWQGRRLAAMKPRLPAAWQQCRRLHQEQLAGLARALAAVNPLATVERGYSILRTPDGHVLRSIEQAPPGSALAAEVSDGVLQLRVERQQPKPATLPLKNPAPA